MRSARDATHGRRREILRSKHERNMRDETTEGQGGLVSPTIPRYEKCGRFTRRLHRYHAHPRYLPYPSRHVSIRGIEEDKYSIVDITRAGKPGGSAHILEEVELSRALFEIYEGAVVCGFGGTARPKSSPLCPVHTSGPHFPGRSISAR